MFSRRKSSAAAATEVAEKLLNGSPSAPSIEDIEQDLKRAEIDDVVFLYEVPRLAASLIQNVDVKERFVGDADGEHKVVENRVNEHRVVSLAKKLNAAVDELSASAREVRREAEKLKEVSGDVGDKVEAVREYVCSASAPGRR